MPRLDIYRMRRDLLKRGNLLVLVLAFVVMMIFYPVDGRFKYRYVKGSPWLYETLESPIDFPLLKTQQELSAERSRMAERFVQYFKTDQDALNKTLTELSTRCFQDSVPQPVQDVLYSTFKRIYTTGIMPERELEERTIFVQRGRNTSQEIEKDLFTPSKAVRLLRAEIISSFPSVNPDSLLNEIDAQSLLTANLTYDQNTTEELHRQAVDFISPTKGMIYAGEHIVSKGETVTAEIAQILDSYKAEYKQSIGYSGNIMLLYLGHALIIIALLILVYTAVYFSDSDILRYQNQFNFVIFIVCLAFVVPAIMRRISPELLYIVPFAASTLYLKSFISDRAVVPVYIISQIPLLLFTESGVELYAIALLAGAAAFTSFSLYERGWLQFLNTIYIFIAISVVHIGFQLINNGAAELFNPRIFTYLFISSILVVVTYPFVFLMEKMFYMVSISTLKDLSDTENKLLEELAAKAPGTFQHSLQVANLAERAVVAIGGNSRVARAGALYHDIGKLVNPQAFIENHTSGFNPHDGLSPKESAQMIIRHVDDGIALADKHKLPQLIKDFILSHHGHSVAEYFYNVYCNQGGDPADKAAFTYHGNLPQSKEEVVVMMADAVEAASRSLSEYSEEKIASLVDSVVEKRISGGQLVRSDVTFRNINVIKAVFRRHLREIYHARIAYPTRNR